MNEIMTNMQRTEIRDTLRLLIGILTKAHPKLKGTLRMAAYSSIQMAKDTLERV